MTDVDASSGPRAAVRDLIGWLTAWVAGVAFLAIFVINLSQIAARASGGGWVWVTDASQLLLLWTVMLGTVGAYCYGEHIVTGLLDGKLRGTTQKALLIVVRAVEILFFLTLVVAGWAVTTTREAIPYVQLGVSTGLAYAAIPTAGVLLLIAAFCMPLNLPEPPLQIPHLDRDGGSHGSSQ